MADQPLNVLRQADQPVTAGSSCLEWLLELPPAAVGRSKEAAEDQDQGPIESILEKRIIDGKKIGIEDHLKNALKTYSPVEIINKVLLKGMKTVGDLFGSGQMQLPFVLQSAETMKYAVSFLEPYMEKTEGI